MEELSSGSTDEALSSKSNQTSKNESRGLHGPSLGIGAGIAIVSIISAFAAINLIDSNPELQFEENPLKPPVGDSISIFTSNSAISLGNENAPITLVEFGDYQCFFCNKFFHETEPSIIKNYVETGKVKIIFKDFTIIGPDSIVAAHATHCANDQGRYWEFHDELYNNWGGENNGWASSENIVKFAQNVGLNEEEFTQCMNEGKFQQLISSSSDDARNLGITGTPAFFVIGPDNQITKISGAQPYEVFQKLFDSELQK
ncbi:MAG TPA: thioredoxin domain-containing protein [Nitrosopumilaceae archaeon]|nr:thioredoxin domain-containing protein [Nitrosopumilaceae archaeon]